MAVRHRELPAEGVQFHPESVLTEQGRELLANFLTRAAMTSGPDLLTRAIDTLASGRDLSVDETAAVLSEIMAGNASEIQIAGFLIALRTKGETVQELAGLARTMRNMASHVSVSSDDLLDTAGHRRRTADVQRLDHRGADRRRRRLHRGQARKPLGDRSVGLGRRARGARARASTCALSRWRAASMRSGSASCSRRPTTRPPGT